MAINKKLIHFLKKENFENEVANGNILDNSIVFIKDTKEIWTHGTYYGSDVEVHKFNIRDIQDIQNIKSFSTHVDTIYYYRIEGNDTVYLDTEDILLSMFLNGNDGAVETLYKTKEAYYKIGETWYSQNLSNYINFPKLHLKTCKGGDLVTVIKRQALASEFYSKFIDFNSISLNLDTLLRAAFEAFKISEGQKNLSDGEFIKYLIRNNKIYSAMRDPNLGEPVYPLAIDGLVTYYEFHIMPNTENMYNGKFWTGNMTGPGIYSYVNAGLPENTDEGEFYTGYVSPDGTQTLVSMKNPNKAFTRLGTLGDWLKVGSSTENNPNRQHTDINQATDLGVYPWCHENTQDIGGGAWTVIVKKTSEPDQNGYYTIEQTAYSRELDSQQTAIRIGFLNSGGVDWHPWKMLFVGGAVGTDSTALGKGAVASGYSDVAIGEQALSTGGGTTALGCLAKVGGEESVAIGYNAEVTSTGSIALGGCSITLGYYSTALGYRSTASGNSSIALGDSANARQSYSMALGYHAETTGYGSIALGSDTIASRESSTALGTGSQVSGSFATALGVGSLATADYSTALGTYNNPHLTENDDSATSLFTLGKGVTDNNTVIRANALEIMKNNDIWFGEYNTGLKVYDGATNTTPFIEKKVGETSKVVLGDGTLKEENSLSVASADVATKLITARKIGITGGAVGTGTNFDGSGDINIPVTKIDEGVLAWSDDYAPTGTLLDNIMKISGNNVLAYMPPSAITIEYSTDNGVTWLDYEVSDANKTRFVTPELGAYRLRLGKDLGSAPLINDRLRITFDFIAGGMRFTPSKVVVKLESLGNNDAFHTRISTEMYENYGQDVWEDVVDQRNTIPDWGTYRLTGSDWGFARVKYRARLRCEFYRTATSVHRTGITNMILMATKIPNANNYAKTGHVYSLDIQQNAAFPANVTATKHITQGGSANQVVLGDGSLRPISELSPITDADADILLNNHIHSINVNANGNDVNISVIESSKNGNNWETKDNDITIPLATTTSAGVMSKEDKIKSDLFEYSKEENSLDCNAKISPAGVEVNNSSETLESKLQLTKSEFTGTEDLCLDITSTNTIPELPAPIVGRIAVSPGAIGSARFFSYDDGEHKEELTSGLFIDNSLSLDEGGVYSKITNEVGYESTIENCTTCVDINSDQYSSSLSIFTELKNHNTGEYSKKEFLVNTAYDGAGIRLWNHKENTSSGIQFSVDNFLVPEIQLVKDGQTEVLINSTGITAPKFITKDGTSTQILMADGSVKEISEVGKSYSIATTSEDGLMSKGMYSALKDGFIANIVEVTTNGNSVELSYDAAYPNGDGTFNMMEGEGVEIPLATTTSAGVMSKEDKAKLDGGNVAIEPDSGMPDLIGDYYDDVDMVAEISLRQYYQPLTEGCLYLMNAIEGGSQCIIMFIYRSDGCIPISTTNTNTMKASISGTTLKITGTDGSGELRIKQIKLK